MFEGINYADSKKWSAPGSNRLISIAETRWTVSTITWTATAAPTGITSKYKWVKIGNTVNLSYFIKCTGTGTGVLSARWTHPNASSPHPPLPFWFTGWDNGQYGIAGDAVMYNTAAPPSPFPNYKAFMRKVSATSLGIDVLCSGGTSVNLLIVSFNYKTED